METGIVKWFDIRDGKKFGFIKLENGEEIFFHYNNGRQLKINRFSRLIVFSDSQTVKVEEKTYRLREPKEGDEIVFVRDHNLKGPFASPWCFKIKYDKALEQVASLPDPVTYQVLETMNDIGKAPGEPKILWIGQDIYELAKQFPRPTGHMSPSADPLLTYWSDSDGIFEIHRWFEKKTSEGFVKCGDPRPE